MTELKEGWYASTNDEEPLAMGPFESREAAIKHVQEQKIDDGEEIIWLPCKLFLTRCVHAEFKAPAWWQVFQEDFHEDQGGAFLEEGWPDLSHEQQEAIEKELTEVLKKHLRAAGKCPLLIGVEFCEAEVKPLK